MKAHLLFEQSGTFKNEFIKLGIEAYDYDILNDFNQTDYQVDLFNEIEKAYEEKDSIFDNFDSEDILMAFFPCIRFENQIILWYNGKAYQQRNWDDIKKLEHDLKLHKELNQMYELITKLTIVALKRKLKLIIENPYSTQHYLTRYWCLEPSIVDSNRRLGGNYYKKPTQYWFIGFQPKNNLIMDEAYYIYPKKKQACADITVCQNHEGKVERSLIHPEYARRFIKEYIL